MVALVIVFDDGLPVGLNVVRDRFDGAEIAERVVLHSGGNFAELLRQSPVRFRQLTRRQIQKEKSSPSFQSNGIE